MGVAGIPWFTTDIGGFHGGDIDDPDFHELLVRWFQFGTFCPVMRMHGDRSADRAGRRDGRLAAVSERRPERAVELRRGRLPDPGALRPLREAMRPYTRSLMVAAHEDGQPVMRGLFHEFPDDPVCWDVADQFMFGPDVLVAPVLGPNATSRRVYLPAGAQWTNLHTGETTRAAVGQVEAPIEVIPVFTRDPALLRQWAWEDASR